MVDESGIDVQRLLDRLASQVADAVFERIEQRLPPKDEANRILLTAEQAADRLNVGRTAVYGLLRTGQLESVRIGHLRRIPKDALDEFVRSL